MSEFQFNLDNRPMINGIPALIDSFRLRVRMGKNGMAGSKRAIAEGATEDGSPYYEYEDALAKPEKVRKRIEDPFLDEAYMAAHVYLHSDLFQEDVKDILLAPDFGSIAEACDNDDNNPSYERRLLDLTVECRNRNLETVDWRELVNYIISATIAPGQYVAHQYVAIRGCIIDGIFFERAALRWEALMMAGPTRENWPALADEYDDPSGYLRPARIGLDPLVFIGDTYIAMCMASPHFRAFFRAEAEHLGL